MGSISFRLNAKPIFKQGHLSIHDDQLNHFKNLIVFLKDVENGRSVPEKNNNRFSFLINHFGLEIFFLLHKQVPVYFSDGLGIVFWVRIVYKTVDRYRGNMNIGALHAGRRAQHQVAQGRFADAQAGQVGLGVQ